MVTIGVTPQTLFYHYQMKQNTNQTLINKEELELSTVGQFLTMIASLNNKKMPVKVIVFSTDHPEVSIPIFEYFEQYHINIKEGIFTNGSSIIPYIKAMTIDLFISSDDYLCKKVLSSKILSVLVNDCKNETDKYKIAFNHHLFKYDGLSNGAVIFLKLLGMIQKRSPEIIEVALITTKDYSVAPKTKDLFWLCECRINSVVFLGDCRRKDFEKLYKPTLYLDYMIPEQGGLIQTLGDGLMYL